MNNLIESIKALHSVYLTNRRVGHTTTMIESLKNSPNSIGIVFNTQQAEDLKKNNKDLKLVSIHQAQDKLRGIDTNTLVLVDPIVIGCICSKALELNNKVKELHEDLQKANDRVVMLSNIIENQRETIELCEEDLWKEMDTEADLLPKVEWIHVGGHRGNVGNERADELASLGRKSGLPPEPAVTQEVAVTAPESIKTVGVLSTGVTIAVETQGPNPHLQIDYLDYCILSILARSFTKSIQGSQTTLKLYDINHEITDWMRPPTFWIDRSLKRLKEQSLVKEHPLVSSEYSITIDGLKALMEAVD